MFDDKTRFGAASGDDRLRRRARGPRRVDQQGDRPFKPLLRDLIPVAAEPRRRRRPTCAASSGRSATPRRCRAGGRGRRPSCSSNLDMHVPALAGVAARSSRSRSSRASPALDAAIRDFPIQRPFLRNSERLFRDLRPGVAALRDVRADDRRRARRRAPGRCPRLRPAQPPPRAAARRAAALLRRPAGPARPAGDLTTTLNIAEPDAGLPDAGADRSATTSRCSSATSPQPLSEGDRNGTWQRFIIIADAAGPEQRGRPVLGPANGPTEDNHLHANPYPNTASPGQPKECEAGNEHLRRRADRDRQPARQPGRATTEKTTPREAPPQRRPQPASRSASIAQRRWSSCSSYLGFTKDIPFTRPLRGQGGVRVVQLDPARLAGADRRRPGRQGQGDQAAAGR